jgi:hypothetical protein
MFWPIMLETRNQLASSASVTLGRRPRRNDTGKPRWLMTGFMDRALSRDPIDIGRRSFCRRLRRAPDHIL